MIRFHINIRSTSFYGLRCSNHCAGVILIAQSVPDGFCFPLLTGVTFDGYDKSVVRIVGGRMFSISPGRTRVTVRWHGFSDSFVVTVTE